MRSDTSSDDNSYGVLTISVASGNNGNNMQCKNNPGCTHLQNRGPIPQGVWSWNVNSLEQLIENLMVYV